MEIITTMEVQNITLHLHSLTSVTQTTMLDIIFKLTHHETKSNPAERAIERKKRDYSSLLQRIACCVILMMHKIQMKGRK